MHTIPFAQATHKQVKRSVQVVYGLDGLSDDEVAFLGCASNLDFGNFDADVACPEAEFFGVFCESSLDCDLLHAVVEFRSFWE